MLCCILENAIENIYFFCFFFFFIFYHFTSLYVTKKKIRLKNHNWGSVVGWVADSGG